jgi:AraC family transcriptional regulator
VILRHLSGDALVEVTSSARLDPICRKDSCIVLAHTQYAECDYASRPLMIATTRGGREWYAFDNRRLTVTEDNFIVLNEGQFHASLIQSDDAVETTKIFFRRGLVQEVLAALLTRLPRLLDNEGPPTDHMIDFDEALHPHDRVVSPVLAYIRRQALNGSNDCAWFEEQFGYLLERLLLRHQHIAQRVRALPCARAGTRKEIHRRIMRAVDYIESCYERPIDLDRLAREACLSKFHFLRAFRVLHGLTPLDYLQRKRALVAKRLLTTTQLPIAQVSEAVGYASRATLGRQMLRWVGATPGALRLGAGGECLSRRVDFATS